MGDYNTGRIRDLRQQRGLSQADVARLLGQQGVKTYASNITRIERGDYGMSLIFGARLAEVLGCSLSDLVNGPSGTPPDVTAAHARGVRDGLMKARTLIEGALE